MSEKRTEKAGKSRPSGKNEKLYKSALTGLMAALCYVAFTFLKIPVPTPGGGITALHVGNAFCVLASLLLGGVYGGLSGAIGMTISDLMDPVYVVSAPKTFVLKFLIGWITGLVAHRVAHISEDHDRKYILKWSFLSSAAGLLFNVIADPAVGYLYKRYLLGIQADASKSCSLDGRRTAVNSVVSIVVVVTVYAAVRPLLKKTGMFMSHIR